MEKREKYQTKKLFIVVNNDFFFLSHRLPIALAAKEKGYDVTVVARNNGCGDAIEKFGLRFINIRFNRNKYDVFIKLTNIYSLYKLYRRERPEIIHHVTIFICILGSIAAKMAHILNVVNAISGFGYNFTESRNTIKQKILRLIMNRMLCNNNFHYILQNSDDYDSISKCRYTFQKNIHLIKGSGVCLKTFCREDFVSKDKLVVLLPARMLRDKGIMEFCRAAQLLKSKFEDRVSFVLCGDLDTINGAGIKKKELLKHLEGQYIIWKGHVDDIRKELKQSDIVVLPSYREGLSKSLIEACAVGRPIITTDTIGCRECVIEGWNGFLVPVKDAAILSQRMEVLINDRKRRESMGENGRLLAEREFSIHSVVAKHLEIYNLVLQQRNFSSPAMVNG
jgi:glycosyltransferase involved in cell wall biosynthesis